MDRVEDDKGHAISRFDFFFSIFFDFLTSPFRHLFRRIFQHLFFTSSDSSASSFRSYWTAMTCWSAGRPRSSAKQIAADVIVQGPQCRVRRDRGCPLTPVDPNPSSLHSSPSKWGCCPLTSYCPYCPDSSAIRRRSVSCRTRRGCSATRQ